RREACGRPRRYCKPRQDVPGQRRIRRRAARAASARAAGSHLTRMSERPGSVPQLQEAIRGLASVRFVGRGSKTGLKPSAGEGTRLDLMNISGIVEYRPAEGIICARAGTRLAEIDAALDARGHSLPVDPSLGDGGASP